MPSFVRGVKRRISHLKQIIHAGKAHPEPAHDRCMSPVLKNAVKGLPSSPVTMPASSRSSTSTDTMAVAGGMMEGKEMESSASSSRSAYSTAGTDSGFSGDPYSGPAGTPRNATPLSSSTYTTAVEDNSVLARQASFELMSASSSSVDHPEERSQSSPEAAQSVERLQASTPASAASEGQKLPSVPQGLATVLSSSDDQLEERPQSTSEAAQNVEPVQAMISEAPAVSEEQESPSPSQATMAAAPELTNVKQDDEEAPSNPPPEQPREDITFTSPPPPALVEPPVPDPFLVDDSASSQEDSENDRPSHPAVSDSQLSVQPAEEISLAASTTLPIPSPSSPAPTSSPDLNKSVPPTPAPLSDDDEDEEETPEVYLPALVHPTMFLPIPNTDPLTTLLTKYISDPSLRPARDLSGEWQGRDFHALVVTNSWRALARMARDRIVATDPEDISLILDLWYLRLASLARLRLTNQASAEMTNLFAVLYALQPPFARDFLLDRLLPFELEVLHARGKYWAGDHMGYLDALWALVRKCRRKAKEAGLRKKGAGRRSGADTSAEREMWVERGSRVVLIIASQLIEMKDFSAATKLLAPLLNPTSHPTPELESAVARIYLQSGHLSVAARHIAEVEANPAASEAMKSMNAAMLATAEGDWPRAADALQRVLEKDPDNFAAVNNLAVVLLSQGLIKEGIDVLEKALRASPSTVVVAEPFLFNLSTLYELRSATAAQNKRNLLCEVAKWSGDGLKTACLKMPSN